MSNNSRYQLISFKLCPFVNRSVITLLEKGIEFDVLYIDLRDKPGWFLQISPMGKVPVLRIGDHDVLFESAVINEYLDDVTPDTLHPTSPLQRAHNRAWIEYGSHLIMTQFDMIQSTDAEAFGEKKQAVETALQQIENQKGIEPFFNGDWFSLVDAAYAPVFHRFDLLKRLFGVNIIDAFPHLSTWAHNLLERSSVRDSIPEDFEAFFQSFFADTYLMQERRDTALTN